MTVFQSLKVRNYRLFASGQVVSLTGTWMQRVAQDWLVLNLSHNSGTAVGITTGLQFAPVLLFGMYGGVIADRYNKRRVLVMT
jgi:MFS family permease